MKNMKSTKSSMGTKASKSMSTKKPSLKKYSAGAIVEVDDKDKGKGKKSTGSNKYMNRFNEGKQDVIEAYKQGEARDTKTYKKYERRLVDGYQDLYNRVKKGVTSLKKGGVVGTSKRK